MTTRLLAAMLLVGLAALPAANLRAQGTVPVPLMIDEVLRASEQHFPRILQSLAARHF